MPIGTPSVPYRLPGSQYERWVDIYTRLGVERILFLGQEVNDGIANSLVAQMLYLDSDDNSKPIYLYINSPGGSVTAGLAIYDTCLLYTSPSPRDRSLSRMPSSA